MPRGRFAPEVFEEWYRRHRKGEPLRSIAEEYEVTPQYVSVVVRRQTANAVLDPDLDDELDPPVNLDKLVEEVNAWLVEQTAATIPEVCAHFGLTSHQWNQIWRRVDNSRLVGKLREASRTTKYRDVDIRKALRRVYRENERRPLSGVVYSELRLPTEPSVPTIHNRYGTWSAACADAKVPCGGDRRIGTNTPTRAHWRTNWEDEELLDWVRKYRDSLSPTERPSYNRYDVWQRTQEGAPSGTLVRVRLRKIGNWSDIIAKVAEANTAA